MLLFSLEMGALELSQRLLCGEARIDSARVRTGKLSEDDWSRISQAIGRLAAAPIWIDDNPNLTVMEIRAKARRLRSQIGDLGMVVVDYLQLMTGRSSAENRQVEVSEISRGLKILARELECPVVALSQLSRQLELRADKRPMLADLRESGCLTGDARVLRADTGAEVPIGDLAASGERDIPVWSLDVDLRLVPAIMSRAFATGVKDCFELRLASGRRVTASANHPFLTVGGWLRLDELAPGSRIAVPGLLAAPKEAGVLPEAQVALLADVLPGGRDRYIPAPVFALGDDQVAAFVDRLWAQGGGDDGTIRWFDAPGAACSTTCGSCCCAWVRPAPSRRPRRATGSPSRRATPPETGSRPRCGHASAPGQRRGASLPPGLMANRCRRPGAVVRATRTGRCWSGSPR